MNGNRARTDLLTQLRRADREHGDATVFFHAALAAEANLHPTDYKALSVLDRLGPMSAGELGRHMSLAAASVTNLIDRLVAKGLLRREPDPLDRRRVLLQRRCLRTHRQRVLSHHGNRRPPKCGSVTPTQNWRSSSISWPTQPSGCVRGPRHWRPMGCAARSWRNRVSMPDDEPSEPRRPLSGNVGIRYASGLVFAHLLTAAEVVAVVISLCSQTFGGARVLLTQSNLALLVVVVVTGTVATGLAGYWSIAPSLRWYLVGGEPDAGQRRSAINIVRFQTAILLGVWAISGVVLIIANRDVGVGPAVLIAVAAAVGGTSCLSTGLLFTQRIFRPIVAAATKEFVGRQTAPGVTARLGIMWLLNSALPAATIALLVLRKDQRLVHAQDRVGGDSGPHPVAGVSLPGLPRADAGVAVHLRPRQGRRRGHGRGRTRPHRANGRRVRAVRDRAAARRIQQHGGRTDSNGTGSATSSAATSVPTSSGSQKRPTNRSRARFVTSRSCSSTSPDRRSCRPTAAPRRWPTCSTTSSGSSWRRSTSAAD